MKLWPFLIGLLLIFIGFKTQSSFIDLLGIALLLWGILGKHKEKKK